MPNSSITSTYDASNVLTWERSLKYRYLKSMGLFLPPYTTRAITHKTLDNLITHKTMCVCKEDCTELDPLPRLKKPLPSKKKLYQVICSEMSKSGMIPWFSSLNLPPRTYLIRFLFIIDPTNSLFEKESGAQDPDVLQEQLNGYLDQLLQELNHNTDAQEDTREGRNNDLRTLQLQNSLQEFEALVVFQPPSNPTTHSELIEPRDIEVLKKDLSRFQELVQLCVHPLAHLNED